MSGDALSSAKVREVDAALVHAEAALASYRELTRSVLRAIYALREIKASGSLTALDAIELRDFVRFSRAVANAFPPASRIPEEQI